MPKRLLISVFALLLVGLAVYGYSLQQDSSKHNTGCQTNPALSTKKIWGETQAVDVEIAALGAEKAQGLSGRDCLNYGAGMLFTYDLSGDYCYWMKDMNFAIDMIWLDDEQKVVTIHDKVAPDSYPNTFCPDNPAQYVLEVDAGFAAQAGWQVGTQFSL